MVFPAPVGPTSAITPQIAQSTMSSAWAIAPATGSVAGADVPGYQQEKDVAQGSRTPTFVAVRLNIRSWRWDGVPFYVRSGKRLSMLSRSRGSPRTNRPDSHLGDSTACWRSRSKSIRAV